MQNPLERSFWLWDNNNLDVNIYITFKKTFDLGLTNHPYLFYISADSQYEAFINGELVGSGQFADYENYKVYDEYDVTSFLKHGVNQITINAYWQGESSSVYKKGAAGVIFSLTQADSILLYSDKDTFVACNPNYKSGFIDKISPQLSFSFEYNATAATPVFRPADIQSKNCTLYPRPIKKLDILQEQEGIVLSQGVFIDSGNASSLGQKMQFAFMSHREFHTLTGKFPPVSLPDKEGITFRSSQADVTKTDGIYILVDILENNTGYLTLEIDLPSECTILIGYGEHLDDLRVRSYIEGRNFCASYKGKKGRNSFIHRYKRAGLRYLQLFVYAHAFTLHYAGIRPALYPVSQVPYFKCSDQLHNKIYDVCVRTLLLCMHEHYEDCPWREQALYSMDSRNQMLCGYYTFGEYDFAKASIRLMAYSIREDNMLELCSPAQVGVTIPSFSAIFVTQLYEYLLHSGDIDFAKEILPAAKRITDEFISRINAANGLVPCFTDTAYWNFYEWQEGLDGGSIFRDNKIEETFDAPLNAFVSMAVQSLARIYAILGNSESALHYERIGTKLNQDIDREFWDYQRAIYASFLKKDEKFHYSELTQSLLVYCNACPDEKLKLVLGAIAEKKLISITLSHSIFKYEALLRLPQTYADYVFQDIAQIWGGMLYNDATTFWETQKGAWDFNNAGSLCHGWSAIPAYLYFKYGIGIQINKMGFTSYQLKPAANSGLENCQGRIKTPTEILEF